MADRPIIFSAPMVRALLDGRKSQTRRILKPAKYSFENNILLPDGANKGKVKLPAIQVGDRLYVREAMHWTDNLRFVADDAVVDFDRMPEEFTAGRAHVSGMFMPRWASRLTLTVTDVRVQRLQEISEADAVAEGSETSGWIPSFSDPDNSGGAESFSAAEAYARLWNSLHGPEAWEANPWVVAYSFTVERRNIDQKGGA